MSTVAEYELLLACYRSGQVSEAQWQGHLSDKGFAAFVATKERGDGMTDNPNTSPEAVAAVLADMRSGQNELDAPAA